MGRAVDFDAQFCFGAVKINDEPPNGMLAAKLVTPVTATQGAPESRLGRRLRMAHLARHLQYLMCFLKKMDQIAGIYLESSN